MASNYTVDETMASEGRNALTELAELLKGEAGCDSAELKEKVIERLGEASWNRHVERKRKYDRASRIIAELAKVEFLKKCDGELVAHPGDACLAVDNCRAIAEEGKKGANNGNK